MRKFRGIGGERIREKSRAAMQREGRYRKGGVKEILLHP